MQFFMALGIVLLIAAPFLLISWYAAYAENKKKEDAKQHWLDRGGSQQYLTWPVVANAYDCGWTSDQIKNFAPPEGPPSAVQPSRSYTCCSPQPSLVVRVLDKIAQGPEYH
jgi:hypothetical protein